MSLTLFISGRYLGHRSGRGIASVVTTVSFVGIVLGVVASVLARYELLTWVTVATAAATVTTSWSEFGDAAHKVERYSSAIIALQDLLAVWNSLGSVEKATRESITNLVITAEAIICEEQASWTSTAAKQDAEKGAQDEEKKDEKKASASA